MSQGYVLVDELAAIVPLIPALDPTDVEGTREAARRVMSAAPRYEAERPLSVEDVVIPGHLGGPDVAGRVYRRAASAGPGPGLIYLHTGGFMFASIDDIDSPARMIADRTGVAVLTVEYRLAPENPYPAALDDCYAALRWAAGRPGREHGFDDARIGVLGESAGGGLAAALALLARDRGGPALAAQILDAPTVDDRLETPSMRDLPDAPFWRAEYSSVSWKYYLGEIQRGRSEVPLYAAPARATVKDLAGLPPAYVTAYQVDVTRDEVLNYARLLIQAGVPCDLHHYGAAFHLAHQVPGTAIGQRMMDDRIEAIRRLLPSGH